MTPEENILKKIRALATMADPTRGGSKNEVEMTAKQMQKLIEHRRGAGARPPRASPRNCGR